MGLNGNYCSSWSCDWKSFGYFDAALGWVGLALVGSLVAFPLSLVKGIRSCRGRCAASPPPRPKRSLLPFLLVVVLLLARLIGTAQA